MTPLTKADQIRAVIQLHPNITNRRIAELVPGVSQPYAATQTGLMHKRGEVNRTVVAKQATGRPVFGYTYALMAPPPVAVPVPKVAAETKYEELELPTTKSKGLDALVEDIAAQLAKVLVRKVKSKLTRELEKMIPALPSPESMDTEAVIEVLSAEKPKLDPDKRKPVVGVVGLLPVQAGEISAEFADVLDLRFAEGGQTNVLKSMATQCDVVFIHTRHMSHSDEKLLLSRGANIRRVTGGVSNLKDAMTTYFVSL
jgi:hypothetical protein